MARKEMWVQIGILATHLAAWNNASWLWQLQ
jgi:hypothetical protein